MYNNIDYLRKYLVSYKGPIDQSLKHVYIYLKHEESKRFIRYCIVGTIGIVVNTAILLFSTEILKIFYLLSSAVAYEISILTNFVMNDRWTFKELVTHKSFLNRALQYNWTQIVSVIFGILLLYIFTEFLFINYIMSNLISIVITTLFRYYMCMNIIWKR